MWWQQVSLRATRWPVPTPDSIRRPAQHRGDPPTMTPRFARRVQRLQPYLFAELERKIAAKREAGHDVISLGIGDPDLPTPDVVVEELQRACARPDTHQYPS